MTAQARKLLPLIFAGLMLFFTFLMLRITWPYFSFRYDVDFLLTKQTVIHIDAWKAAFYIHISSSIFTLFLGAFQFIDALRINKPRLHRQMGKIYVYLVLLLSAPSGLIMAFYANGGGWARLSFALIAILWWYFTYAAFRSALRQDFKAHRNFMYRSYALTLSAISLRTYVFTFPFFMHLPARDMYVLVSWLSWVPNLLVAELLIRTRIFANEIR
jgi:uncharacterized membrane protein